MADSRSALGIAYGTHPDGIGALLNLASEPRPEGLGGAVGSLHHHALQLEAFFRRRGTTYSVSGDAKRGRPYLKVAAQLERFAMACVALRELSGSLANLQGAVESLQRAATYLDGTLFLRDSPPALRRCRHSLDLAAAECDALLRLPVLAAGFSEAPVHLELASGIIERIASDS